MSDARQTLHDGLAPLLRRLRRQRRIRDLLWLTTASLVGGPIARLIDAYAVSSTFGPSIPIALGAAMGALVTAPILAFRHRRTPIDAIAAARLAEREERWRDRFSSALEHADGSNTVRVALLRDAERHIEHLDPEQVAPARLPRRPLVALIASLTVAAAVALVPIPASVADPHTATGDGPPAPSGTAVGELADEVAGAARRSRDAYLASLADDLRALADEAGEAPLRDRERASLDDVLDAIERASGGALSADDLHGRLAQRDEELRAEASDRGDEARGDDRESLAPPPSMGVSGAGPSADLGDVFTRQQEGADDDDRAPSSGGANPSANAAGELEATSLDEDVDASSFDGPGPSGGEADVIGAAEDARAGDSRLAGRGSQGLEGDAEQLDLGDVQAEAVGLAGSERDEGRRIEIEMPPDAEWQDYDPASFDVGAWRATPEALVDSDPTPLHYREAAGRYFLPSQATASSR